MIACDSELLDHYTVMEYWFRLKVYVAIKKLACDYKTWVFYFHHSDQAMLLLRTFFFHPIHVYTNLRITKQTKKQTKQKKDLLENVTWSEIGKLTI